MKEQIRFFKQSEYTRILDSYKARDNNFSQNECEKILIKHGASYQQAKNGAYVYLHHYRCTDVLQKTSQYEYNKILDNFNATKKMPQECIKYLESLGYSYGQSKSAVYKYRVKCGLIGT